MSEMLWKPGLTADVALKARIELGETDQVRGRCLKEMRKLIEETSEYDPLCDDVFLLRFLRCKKFDVGRAVKTLRNYYSYRARYSGRVMDRTPRDLLGVLGTGKLLFSPRVDREGAAVVIIHFGSYDLAAPGASSEELVAAILCATDLVLSCEPVQVGGFSVVNDWSGFTLRRVLAYSRPGLLAQGVGALLETFPCRVKGIHNVFEPRQMTFLFNTFCKPLLTKKLRERMHFHGDDLQNLLRHVPQECLPQSLGGILGEKDYDDFRKQLHSRQALSERLATYVYNGIPYPNRPQSGCSSEDET